MTSHSDLIKQLKRPWPVNKLKWRKGPGGKELVYIDARMVKKRLDDVFGMDWQCTYTETNEKSVVCNIGVKVGDQWIWRSDGAGESNIEAEKGMYSDAFKRAAVRFGVGEYLYTGFDKNNIPKWAPPEGYDELMGDKDGD